MTVETIGEALQFGWRVTARCAWGKREAMKSIRECRESRELDLATLVWTRGASFPLDQLASRLKCPHCNSRAVRVVFDVPKIPRRSA
jgi:hypothetical protein